jgi:site-specific DNA-methyltransferase (adenine-specific)
VTPYYEQDGITIYHGDCREILPALPTFDLLLTDPPYGIGIAANPVRQAHERSDWDNQRPDRATLGLCLSMAQYQIVWGGNYFGLPPSQCFLVWDKGQPQDFSLAMCEQAWTNLKLPAKLFRKSVLSYKKQHPTEKPVELMRWCIERAGRVSSVIDPFAGSGPTGEAAKLLGLTATLIEAEERYCEIAAKRLSQGVLPIEQSA